MPKPIKKRVAKQDVKTEDSVRTFFSGVAERIESNFRYIVFATAAVLLVLAVAAGLLIARMGADKKAQESFYEGYRLYHGLYDDKVLTRVERFEGAIESFRESYDAGGSPQALMYLANSQYALGRYEEALSSIGELLKKFPEDDIYVPLALYKAAMVELKLDRPEEALNDLDRLYSFAGPDTFKDFALAESAGILESLGRTEEAKKKYEVIVEEFPGSPFAEEARLRSKEGEEEAGPGKAEEGG